jgi:hypothetical protein
MVKSPQANVWPAHELMRAFRNWPLFIDEPDLAIDRAVKFSIARRLPLSLG